MDLRYKLFKLFVDRSLQDPVGTLSAYLSHIGVMSDEEAVHYCDVAPDIVASYFGRPLSETVVFYTSHMMKIADANNILEELDFDQMRVSQFETGSGHRGIVLSVPKVT